MYEVKIMKVNSKGEAVRNAIQCFGEVCRRCKNTADVCNYCEIGVATDALKQMTPIEVEYSKCTNCAEVIFPGDNYCRWCGSPLVGRDSGWE